MKFYINIQLQFNKKVYFFKTKHLIFKYCGIFLLSLFCLLLLTATMIMWLIMFLYSFTMKASMIAARRMFVSAHAPRSSTY